MDGLVNDMDIIKYTLDRIEDGQYVFLEHPEEITELIIPIDKIPTKLSEGDIVNINIVDSEYKIDRLIDETANMKEKVSSLLKKLKNKK